MEMKPVVIFHTENLRALAVCEEGLDGRPNIQRHDLKNILQGRKYGLKDFACVG
jgi:hypothetical protein